jgi:hypothetical protein
MPWKKETREEQRWQFVGAVQRGEADFAAICRGFGISRQTG